MSENIKLPVHVGTVYTMEALVPGGSPRLHASLSEGLDAGTKLYTADQLRAAVLADREGRQWQPIETAPWGRKLLVGYPNSHGIWRTVTARYYSAGALEWDVVGDIIETEDEFAPEGWYEESETHETILPLGMPPTHWQPLPTPPADAQRAKGE